MKLGNSPKISLPTHQNGVKNRDRVYFKTKEEFCILTNAASGAEDSIVHNLLVTFWLFFGQMVTRKWPSYL